MITENEETRRAERRRKTSWDDMTVPCECSDKDVWRMRIKGAGA